MAVNAPPGNIISPAAPSQREWSELSERPIIAIPVNIANGGQVVVEGAGILIGWAFRETAAQVTPVDFYDGRGTGGNGLGSTSLAASGANAQSVGVAGAMFKGGLFIQAGTGTIKGAVWVRI